MAALFQALRHLSAHPALARPAFAAGLGVPTTTFRGWAEVALAGRSSGGSAGQGYLSVRATECGMLGTERAGMLRKMR